MQNTPPPFFSIIIPARDEESYLPACLQSITEAAHRARKTSEIIVVINRCKDNTEYIAREAGCRIAYDDSKNLAKIRNAGARIAKGTLLVTIDADSTMSANMLREIETKMQSGSVIGGGVLILPERWSLGIFFSIISLLPIVLRYGISGGLFFSRLEDFQAIGGFNEELCTAEDIDFAKRLKRYGKTTRRRFVTLLKAHIKTSCRKFDALGDWYFVKHPRLILRLLRGRSQKEADRIWYEIERG